MKGHREDPIRTRIASISGFRRNRRSAADAASKQVDSRLQLRDGRLRDSGSAAEATQLGVDSPVRIAGLARVDADQTVQQLPLLTQRAVQGLGQGRRRRRFCRLTGGAELALSRLALHEQFVDVLRLEKTGEPDELLFFGCAGFGELSEILAVEDDAVEVRE